MFTACPDSRRAYTSWVTLQNSTRTHINRRSNASSQYQHTLLQLQGSFNQILNFNTPCEHVCVCVCVCRGVRCPPLTLLTLQSDTISGALCIGVWVCVSDGVVRASAQSPSVCLSREFFNQLRPLNTHTHTQQTVCASVCPLSGCLPIRALVRLSVCLSAHLPVCAAAFQPVCLGAAPHRR